MEILTSAGRCITSFEKICFFFFPWAIVAAETKRRDQTIHINTSQLQLASVLLEDLREYCHMQNFSSVAEETGANEGLLSSWFPVWFSVFSACGSFGLRIEPAEGKSLSLKGLCSFLPSEGAGSRIADGLISGLQRWSVGHLVPGRTERLNNLNYSFLIFYFEKNTGFSLLHHAQHWHLCLNNITISMPVILCSFRT